MNKTLLSTALVATLGALAFMPAAKAATAIDGTININGQVVASTCTVSVNGGSNTGTVTLKPAPVASLSAAANTYGDMPFTIGVTGCDASLNGKTVTPFWSGANINANGRLNNTTGTATNVNVQLMNGDDATAINLSGAEGNQGTTGVAVASGAATMTYYARYYATGAATAGSVTSSVNYTLIYQ